MTTTTVTTTDEVMTLVNVFTVDPADQQQLIDILVEAADTMIELPGFVSANLHRSDDGRRVVNYVQWRSEDDFEAMKRDPRAVPHMQRAADLAQYDPIVCRVVDVKHV